MLTVEIGSASLDWILDNLAKFSPGREPSEGRRYLRRHGPLTARPSVASSLG